MAAKKIVTTSANAARTRSGSDRQLNTGAEAKNAEIRPSSSTNGPNSVIHGSIS